MIQEFVDRFMRARPGIEESFREHEPEEYADIVRAVVEAVSDESDDCGTPDPGRIHEIEGPDIQGVLVYVIPETGYAPERHWYVRIAYGTCCGCDTLEHIQYCEDREQRIADYMTLALHVVQAMREMDVEPVPESGRLR